MRGLTVRWSLEGAREGIEQELADYVAESSHAKFTGLPGLAFKTWRCRPGEWFEGVYVFESDAARSGFQASFEQAAPTAPATRLLGAPPVLIEPFDVIAVAAGAIGFSEFARA